MKCWEMRHIKILKISFLNIPKMTHFFCEWKEFLNFTKIEDLV